MKNPFEIVKTNWVEVNGTQARIVAPMWLAWAMVRFDHLKLGPRIGYMFSKFSKRCGAYIEIRV